MNAEQDVDPEKKWDEFMKWLRSHSDNWIFRGVSDREEHLLIPSIGRTEDYNLGNEINLFEQFKLKANLFIPKVYNDFEWLVLAQHHGLNTRLLDWSFNPLVAAFFAVTNIANRDFDGRIYTVQPSASSFIDLSVEKSPFELERIKFLIPAVSTRRIELQKGLFSIHPQPSKACIITCGDLIEIEEAYKSKSLGITKNRLKRLQGNPYNYQEEHYHEYPEHFFNIPFTCKSYFEENIRALGVDETFFGDIDSISKYLNHQLKTRKLHTIYIPPKKSIYANLRKVIEDEASEFLLHNQEIFACDLSAVFINPNDIHITIEDMTHQIYGNEIYGKIKLALITNLIDGYGLFQDREPPSRRFLVQYYHFLRRIDIKANLLYGVEGIEIDFKAETNEIDGKLECYIFGYNLSEPISKIFIEQSILYRKYYQLLSDNEREIIETSNRHSKIFTDLIESKKKQIN